MKAAAPETRERTLSDEFEAAKRLAEAASVFVRVPADDGGRFPLTGRGDVNTYALFAELFSRLTGPRGRAGVVLPTGILTDDTFKLFFQSIAGNLRLVSALNFSEIWRWFPATDDRKPFCLLCLGATAPVAQFVFGIDEIGELANPERRFTLSPSQIAAINPNTKTAPVFRSRADAELTARIYARVPVLIEGARGRDGNPWELSLATMFHMANDSGLFRTASQLRAAGFEREGVEWVMRGLVAPQGALEPLGGLDGLTLGLTGGSLCAMERYVPLYEAKMIHQFDHRYGDARSLTVRPVNAPWPAPQAAEIEQPDFEPTPWYWVEEAVVHDRLRDKGWTRDWLLCWRRSARGTDLRTMIVCAIPSVGVGDNLFLMNSGQSAAHGAGLIGCFNSLVLDFVARQKVSGANMSFYFIEQFPVLPPSMFTPTDLAVITPRVLELTYTSNSLAPFARDLGYEGPPFAWNEDRRALLRAELDAYFARAYGLTRDELRYILDPADVRGPDYPSETFRVLKENEKRRYGEYRTARLVLDAWDRMERGELT